LIRLSVGLESIEDIIEDVENALKVSQQWENDLYKFIKIKISKRKNIKKILKFVLFLFTFEKFLEYLLMMYFWLLQD
jgi:hypothetical protein